MQYGQFCPVSKAAEILGERWTLLIIREILNGGRRFSELQRGLSTISPALLTERLNGLADRGLIVKRRIPGQRGFEYFPTAPCLDLGPVLHTLGEWGMRYAKDSLVDEDYDVDLLMLYMERTIATEKLPGATTVLRFEFKDMRKERFWWLIVDGDQVDICIKNPGRDVYIFFKSTLRTMTDVWLGHRSYKAAIKDGSLEIIGPRNLVQTVGSWLRCVDYAHVSAGGPLELVRTECAITRGKLSVG
jgi:DNA-binding HxlR family transcriptional regulator